MVKRRLVVYEPKNMQQSETSEYAAWRRVSLEPHARARTCCPRRLRMRIFTEVAARSARDEVLKKAWVNGRLLFLFF